MPNSAATPAGMPASDWNKYFDKANWSLLANLFPMMEQEEIENLASDITKNGLTDLIVLHEDKVLDGRNRLLAMELAGISLHKDDFIEWADMFGGEPTNDTLLTWVVSKNLHRRHLTTSQRAVVAVEMETLFAAEIAKREHERKTTKVNLPESSKGQARDKAAAAMQVSPSSVGHAKKLKKEDPKAFEEVKAGKQTLNAAKPKKTACTCPECGKAFLSITTALNHGVAEHGISVLEKSEFKRLLKGLAPVAKPEPESVRATDRAKIPAPENGLREDLEDAVRFGEMSKENAYSLQKAQANGIGSVGTSNRVGGMALTRLRDKAGSIPVRHSISSHPSETNHQYAVSIRGLLEKEIVPLLKMQEEQRFKSKPASVADLTETFYVIRRKSDGAILHDGGLAVLEKDQGQAVIFSSHVQKFHEVEINNCNGGGFQPFYVSRTEWEWVKVQATYQLTAVPQTPMAAVSPAEAQSLVDEYIQQLGAEKSA